MKLRILSIFTVLMLALVACNPGNMNDNQEGRQADDNVQPTRYNETRDQANDGRNRMNQNDRNYMMDRNREHEGRDNRGMNREDRDRDHRDNAGNNERYDVADEAADRITDDVKDIDRAYVLTTKNNAYVAATMDGDRDDNRNKRDNERNKEKRNDKDDGLTDEVKKEIKDIVKSVDNDIDNVYVSTNPDFFDLTNNYVDDMNDGKPVRGFFDQFGNMIERLFPQNKR